MTFFNELVQNPENNSVQCDTQYSIILNIKVIRSALLFYTAVITLVFQLASYWTNVTSKPTKLIQRLMM